MTSKVNSKVVAFINNEFGEDINSISKAQSLYDKLLAQKNNIESNLNFASSEVPGKLEIAVKDAEACGKQIEGFSNAYEELSGDICNHKADVMELSKKLTQMTYQIDGLMSCSSYLQCVAKIEDLSQSIEETLTESPNAKRQFSFTNLIGNSDIQTALIVGAVDKAVRQFSCMTDLVQTLHSSRCQHLVKFAGDTLLYWHKILKDKLAVDFDKVLTAWRWPFIVSTAKPGKPLPNITEVKNRLPNLFTNLLHLQLPAVIEATQPTQQHPLLAQMPCWRPILLPLQLMLKPLKKRFRYHFYGNKQTNSLDKPEWYMTQVLMWLRDHSDFLNTQIQPLLDKAGRSVTATCEFTRGLILLVIEKMHNDMPELLYDDHTFCHFIDEALAFNKEITSVSASQYDYSGAGENALCLAILTSERCFEKWLKIEKKFAMEKMDVMMSSVSAWESQYKSVTEIDDQKLPECTEAFITLMTSITDRYKPLPSLQHKVKFVELQLELLEDYRLRLVQVKTAHTDTPLANNYTAILNSVNYVAETLRRWTDMPFFMELHLYKLKYESACSKELLDEEAANLVMEQQDTAEDNGAGDTGGAVEMSEHGAESGAAENRVVVNGLNHGYLTNISLAEQDVEFLEGTVFDTMIELYEHLRSEMLNNVLHYVVDDVKARSKPYRKDKWLSLPSQKDVVSLALSASACEMLMVLKDLLQQVCVSLGRDLFTTCWQRVARDLNTFIFKQVIISTHFNDGGAAQLQFDMVRNLFPLFGQYTQKPENYFKDVKEACILLTLKAGSALLLKEVLYVALHDPRVDQKVKLTDPVAALHDIGVFKLSPDDAELVLSLRANLGN